MQALNRACAFAGQQQKLLPFANMVFWDGENTALTDGVSFCIFGKQVPKTKWCVDAHVLGRLLKNMTDIRFANHKCIVTAGASTIRLETLEFDPNEFMSIAAKDKVEPVPFDSRAAREVAYASGGSESFGVFFDQNTLAFAATDGHRMAWSAAPTGAGAVHIPREFAKKCDSGDAYVHDGKLLVVSDDAFFGTMLLSRPAPNIAHVAEMIRRDNHWVAHCKRSQLIDALSMAIRVGEQSVEFVGDIGLTICGERSTTTVEIEENLSECSVRVNPEYALQAVRQCSDEYVRMEGSHKSANDWLSFDSKNLLMGVRK